MSVNTHTYYFAHTYWCWQNFRMCLDYANTERKMIFVYIWVDIWYFCKNSGVFITQNGILHQKIPKSGAKLGILYLYDHIHTPTLAGKLYLKKLPDCFSNWVFLEITKARKLCSYTQSREVCSYFKYNNIHVSRTWQKKSSKMLYLFSFLQKSQKKLGFA